MIECARIVGGNVGWGQVFSVVYSFVILTCLCCLLAAGKEMIEMYFDFRLFRLWKSRQHSKLLDYDDLLWLCWLVMARLSHVWAYCTVTGRLVEEPPTPPPERLLDRLCGRAGAVGSVFFPSEVTGWPCRFSQWRPFSSLIHFHFLPISPRNEEERDKKKEKTGGDSSC